MINIAVRIILMVWAGFVLCPRLCCAQEDSLEFSLLTCGPGEEVYELYGHTALRMKNLSSGEDWVFNYGIFDFEQPNFVWNFICGKTDYTMGVVPFNRFLAIYGTSGRYVDEQVLNLRTDEKMRLRASLIANWQTEGWTYRYNYLYDNCTTRAVGMVVAAVNGSVEWGTPFPTSLTVREVLHEFSASYSWMTFGNDLILGAGIDSPASVGELLFSPIYAQSILSASSVRSADGAIRPFVLCQRRILEEKSISNLSAASPFTPMAVVVGLCVVLFLVCIAEKKKNKICHFVDYSLMLVLGLAGVIISFLFFCSEHPMVDTNCLILLLNPLPLFFLPYKVFCDRRGRQSGYEYLLASECVLLLVVPIGIGQKIPTEIVLLASMLLFRVLFHWKKHHK